MIARIWHGATTEAKSDAYLERMRAIALPDYRSTPGNRGAWCLRRAEGGHAHFLMLTLWEDLDAIRRFAGEEPQRAKYYDFDADFLVEQEAGVVHYEVWDR